MKEEPLPQSPARCQLPPLRAAPLSSNLLCGHKLCLLAAPKTLAVVGALPDATHSPGRRPETWGSQLLRSQSQA